MPHCHKKCFLLVKHEWLMPVILATQEAEIRRIKVASLSSRDPISKQPNTKTRLAEWLESLPSKPSTYEALSSNPSITQKKKKSSLFKSHR
jgi:hypothetical protein